MMLLAAQSAAWIPLHEDAQVGILLVTFVFPLEGIAAIFAFLARDTVAATVLGLFTTSWLANGVLLIVGAPGATSLALGFYLLAFAGAVFALAAIATLGKPLIALVLTLSGARSVLDGLYQVTGTTGLEHAAGIVAATIAGAAWYGGTAMVFEDLRQRPLLATLRRGAGRAALQQAPFEQLERARLEAGVRQQL
jgi:succinate-acetate transporter protein